MLAVVYALTKFRQYLLGAEFDLITDSAAVMGLRSTTNLTAKLARWSLFLADYDFVLIHKPGKTHTNVDGLTRSHTNSPADDPDVGITVHTVEVMMVNIEETLIPSSDSASEDSVNDDTTSIESQDKMDLSLYTAS